MSNNNFIDSFSENGGGALLLSGDDVQLLNCNFTNTTVNSSASGVIDWGGSTGDIKNCNVENSNINVSVYIDGYYPTGLVNLEANNFEGLIYIVDGSVLSQTYLEVITNTYYLDLNDQLLLDAILLDDNGNRICDKQKITYAISNGEEIVSSKENWEAQYTFNQTGEFFIDASLSNIKNVTVVGAIVVVRDINNDTDNDTEDDDVIHDNNETFTDLDDDISNFSVGYITGNPLILLLLMMSVLLFMVPKRFF